MVVLYTSCKVENHVDHSKSVSIRKLLVDAGSEYTWIPTFAGMTSIEHPTSSIDYSSVGSFDYAQDGVCEICVRRILYNPMGLARQLPMPSHQKLT
jgi:hypothetical protein